MTQRALELLLLVALGGVWGWAWDSPIGTFGGSIFGTLVWVFWDGQRAKRFLEWLNRGEAHQAPALSGVWAELVERNRKLIKKLEKKSEEQ